MQPVDTESFYTLWDQCAEVYDKAISDDVKALYFKLLVQHKLSDIKLALQAHMVDTKRGQWMPKPADVIAKIEERHPSPWPGAEEAWAKFPRDETQSGLVCDEMLEAWGVSVGLDDIAGRMAFRERYNKLIGQAKAENRKPQWKVSFGLDKQQRESVVLDAVRDNLISPSAGRSYLPHIPESELIALANQQITADKLLENHAQTVESVDQLLLAAPDQSTRDQAKQHVKGLLEMLR